MLNSGCLLFIIFLQFLLYLIRLEIVLIWGACFSLIMVGLLSVLEALFQILHAESISNVMRQLLKFLKQVKNLFLLFAFLWFQQNHFIQHMTLIIFWYSKQSCLLKVAVTNISFFLISALSSSILSMTMLFAWCSSGKISGPSHHGLPCLSCCRRLAGSINPLVHISAGFIFPSVCCQSPASL